MSLPRWLHKGLIIRGFVSAYCMSSNLTKSLRGNHFRTVHIVYNHLDHNFLKYFLFSKGLLIFSNTLKGHKNIYEISEKVNE